MWLEILICQFRGTSPSGRRYSHIMFLIWFWTIFRLARSNWGAWNSTDSSCWKYNSNNKGSKVSTPTADNNSPGSCPEGHYIVVTVTDHDHGNLEIHQIHQQRETFPDIGFEIFLLQGLQQFSFKTGEFQICRRTTSSNCSNWCCSEWSVFQPRH